MPLIVTERGVVLHPTPPTISSMWVPPPPPPPKADQYATRLQRVLLDTNSTHRQRRPR